MPNRSRPAALEFDSSKSPRVSRRPGPSIESIWANDEGLMGRTDAFCECLADSDSFGGIEHWWPRRREWASRFFDTRCAMCSRRGWEWRKSSLRGFVVRIATRTDAEIAAVVRRWLAESWNARGTAQRSGAWGSDTRIFARCGPPRPLVKLAATSGHDRNNGFPQAERCCGESEL